MKEAVQILQEAFLTEKATMLSANMNQYVFCVGMDADKRNIKDAIESSFGVTVLNVNTMLLKPKPKRDRSRRNRVGYTRQSKKAIVTLKAGDSIDLA